MLEGKEGNSLSESSEDYLLDIYILGKSKGIVRLKDIARKRDVKMPSAVGALRRLEERGFVRHERYGYVELTDKGFEKAAGLKKRHETVFKFFHEILNLEEDLAEVDVHRIEHRLNEKTLKRISDFIEFVNLTEDEKRVRRCFCYSHFSENGELPDRGICRTQLLLTFGDQLGKGPSKAK